MRLGVVLLPQQRWAQDRTRWQRVEEWGFDHAWTYDHLAWRTLADEPWLATVPLLTAAATATSRIRLGTWVASPNFRHPVPFAKDVMGLDDVADGRLTLGLGAGGGGVDAEMIAEPLSPRDRTDRFAEFLALLDALLTGPVTDHEGRWYRARGARMYPGCVQRPRVPFVVAANGPKAMALAVRYGQGWATTGPTLAMDVARPTVGEVPRGGGGTSGTTTGAVASGGGAAASGSVGRAYEAWWAGLATQVARFEEACAAAGRDPGALDRYLSVDAAPVFSLSSEATAVETVERAAGLGFTDVVVHWPRAEGVYAGRLEVLEAVAARLPELRAVQPRR